MKKITPFIITAILILSASSITAQKSRSGKTSPIFRKTFEQATRSLNTTKAALEGLPTEGFEDDATLDAWTISDADGDQKSWEATYFVDENENTINWGNNNSVSLMISESWDGTTELPLTPDNYLITPQIKIIKGYTLTYHVLAIDGYYPAEKYEVLIKTTDIETGTWVTLFTQTLTAPDSVWTKKEIDLSAYDGSNVFIAFRHFESTDNYMIGLDDITVGNATTAIVNHKIETTLSVFPNPAEDYIKVHNTNKINKVKLYNLAGKEVINARVNAKSINLDVSSLNDGLYILKATTEEGTLSKTISVR